ncbi:hypothetical protein LJC44_03470 [Parabacteroides sp. OttesenSCG-928-G06]|nr:hypothetical protein [Parabacteroides sp. OttesenSCG-928-K15]MDL2282161.1 hypothetical protein [Parabacteroides sp. OttesenSCG-928-G06]
MIAKLNIEIYEDKDFKQKVHTIVLQINPEDFKEEKSVSYEDRGNMSPVYKHHERSNLTISFVIDGTGVVPSEEEVVVSDKINELEKYLYEPFTKSDVTQTYFILVKWGKLHFQGRLTKMDVHYTLFKPDGEPLRAKVTLHFTQTGTMAKAVTKKKNAPQQKKQVTVQDGQNLSCVCHCECNDPTLDRQLAAENNLPSMRGVKAGQTLNICQ